MVTQRQTLLTPEEYLERERAAEYKSEYLDGEVFALAGGSPQHNRIGFNLAGVLHAQLRGGPCSGYTSDQRVGWGNFYTYPDLTVVCGEPRFEDEHRDTLSNPILIIEVLSSSTQGHDRGEQFWRYQQIDSLREYLLVAQDVPRVERYLRQDDGTWNYVAVGGLEGVLKLHSIGCELRLAGVYEGVDFEGRTA